MLEVILEKTLKEIEDEDWEKDRRAFAKFADLISDFEKSLPETSQVGAIIDGVVFIVEKLSLIRESRFLLISGHRPDGATFQTVRQLYPLHLSLLELPTAPPQKSRRLIGFEVQAQ